MAKVQIKMPEDFLLKLSRLGDKTDEILPKVLEAGGEVVLGKGALQLAGGHWPRYQRGVPLYRRAGVGSRRFPRPRLTGRAITT